MLASFEQDCQALLARGPGPAYPLPPDEGEEAWRQAASGALAALRARPPALAVALASTLRPLLQEALGPGLEQLPGRARLLGELLRNLEDPGRINQGFRGVCTAACVEAWLAEARPEEYARLVVGLCLEAGELGLPGGERLRRDEARLAWTAAEGRRSPVSRLFQAAAMELADQRRDYDNQADGQGEGTEGAGLGAAAFDHLLEALTGEAWALLSDGQEAMARVLGIDPATIHLLSRDGRALIERSLAKGDPVFVTLQAQAVPLLPQGSHPLARLPHKVRILEIRDERVIYEDPLDPEAPWVPGVPSRVEDRRGRCSMAWTDLQGLMVELSYRPVHAFR